MIRNYVKLKKERAYPSTNAFDGFYILFSNVLQFTWHQSYEKCNNEQ